MWKRRPSICLTGGEGENRVNLAFLFGINVSILHESLPSFFIFIYTATNARIYIPIFLLALRDKKLMEMEHLFSPFYFLKIRRLFSPPGMTKKKWSFQSIEIPIYYFPSLSEFFCHVFYSHSFPIPRKPTLPHGSEILEHIWFPKTTDL